MAKHINLASGQVSSVVNGTITINTYNVSKASAELPMGDYMEVLFNITNAGAATGTVNLFIQDSWDGGTTWDDVVAGATITLGTTSGTQRYIVQGLIATGITQGSAVSTDALTNNTIRVGPFGPMLRLREKVSGASGTPTGCTYSVDIVLK